MPYPISSRATLRTYFETGDVPTQVQFETFLESYVHLWDSNSGSIYIYGPGHITASGNISASGTGSFSYLHLSPIPTGSSNTVLILDSNDNLHTDEIDGRVWLTGSGAPFSSSLVDAEDNITIHNLPKVKDGHGNGPTIIDSIVFQSNAREIGINTGWAANYGSTLRVSGSIATTGSFSITSSNDVSASAGLSASNLSIHGGSPGMNSITDGAKGAEVFLALGKVAVESDPQFTVVGGASMSLDLEARNITASEAVWAKTNLIVNANSNIGLGISNTHKFIGHVTTSGHISASGVLMGSAAYIKGPITASGIISSSAGITSSNAQIEGNVSASHYVYAKTASIADRIEHTGDINTHIVFTSGSNGRMTLACSGSQIDFNPPNITVNNIMADHDFVVLGSGSGVPTIKSDAGLNTIGIGVNPGTQTHNKLMIGGNTDIAGVLKVTNITASGFISASGTDHIIGSSSILGDNCTDSIHLKGAVTAACAISSSGNATFLDIHARNITASQNIKAAGTISSSAGLYGTSLYARGPITASGIISSSGGITGSNFQTSGPISASGDIFGHDLIIREITASGPISAVGQISSSANLSGRNIYAGGDITASYHISASGTLFGSNAYITGPITASGIISTSAGITGSNAQIAGNISSSAVIYGHKGSFVNTFYAGGHISSSAGLYGASAYITGPITASGIISTSAGITASNAQIAGSISASETITAANFIGNIAASNIVQPFTNITASGIISSSGGITSSNAQIAGQISASGVVSGSIISSDAAYLAGDTRVIYNISNEINLGDTDAGSPTKATVIKGTNITLDAPVTASGIISSSGTIYTDVLFSGDGVKTLTIDTDDLYHKGASFRIDGNISSSGNFQVIGNISGSGTSSISGQDLTLDRRLIALGSDHIIHSSSIIGTNCTDNIHLKGAVTAACDISASGTITATTFIGNIAASNIVQPFTNITASGNISASGALMGSTAYITGPITASGIISSSAGITSSNAQIAGNISASGVISASAFHGSLNLSSVVATNITSSNISASGVISASEFVGNINTSNIVQPFTNITASGQISASGGVTSSVVHTGKIVNNGGSNFVIDLNGEDMIFEQSGGAIDANATELTVGNISSSGNANYFGNIQSSGIITASAFTGSGGFFGTSSWALNSQTASYVETAQTASWVSSSNIFGTITAEWDGTYMGSPANPAQITASLIVSGHNVDLDVQGNISSSGIIRIPTTNTTVGSIYQGTDPVFHTVGTRNLFVGQKAGNFSVSGNDNVILGASASIQLSSGDNNVAVGANALEKTTLGNRNIAIGKEALKNNISGDGNIAIGYQAGQNNTTSNKLFIANDNNPNFIYGDMYVGGATPPTLTVSAELVVTESISASGELYTSNSLDPANLNTKVVTWDSASGRYYVTGAYGGSGGGAADNLGNHTATQSLQMAGFEIRSSSNIYFQPDAKLYGANATAQYYYINTSNNAFHEIIGSAYVRSTYAAYSQFYTNNHKIGIGLPITENTIANLQVSGNLHLQGPNGNISASKNISASGLLYASTSVGNYSNVVVQDITTGRFYTTASTTLASSTTQTFYNTGLRDGNAKITGSLILSGGAMPANGGLTATSITSSLLTMPGTSTITATAGNHNFDNVNLNTLTNTGNTILGNAGTDTVTSNAILYPSGGIVFDLLTMVDAHDDTTAAALGVPVGGIYRNGNLVSIRLS